MRQACRDGVRSVLTKNRCRVRDLRRVPPPQTDRELLSLFLKVIADVQLRIVADAIVHASEPLPGILIESNIFNPVVVARRGRGIGVRLRQNV